MKPPSDDLFLLIKSLDTQEKVYFKAFGAKKRQDVQALGYMKLFDVLDKLKEYDESVVRINLVKKGFNYNLKNAKELLTEAIYKSLAEYHSGQSITRQLQNLIYYAEILYGKLLNKAANSLIKRVEKLALQFEQYQYLLIANTIKLSAIRQTQNMTEIENYINKDIDKMNEYFDRLKNISDYHTISLKLEKLEHSFASTNLKQNGELKKIMESDLLKSPDKALTFISLHQYYFIHFLFYKLTASGNELAYRQQKEWMEFLESNKNELPFRAGNYLGVLARLVTIMVHSGMEKELEEIFTKARNFLEGLPSKIRTKTLKAVFLSITINYMGGQTMFQKPEKAIESWENVKHMVTYEALSDSMKLVLCGNLFHSHFLLEEYHKALNYLNKIINSKTQNRLDIQNHARIYLLMTYYELVNLESLPYMAESARRFLIKNNKSISMFDKIILNYFERVLPKIGNKKEEFETFSKWKQELEHTTDRSILYSGIKDFDFMLWIDCKIEKRPFAEILREKAKRLAGS